MSQPVQQPVRPLVVLHIAALTVPNQLRVAQGVVAAMTGNPAFSSPVPTLATVTAGIGALAAAETEALSRTRGAVAARDEKRAALLLTLDQLRGYVQVVADADPASAVEIIESSGMSVRRRSQRAPRGFLLSAGRTSGSIVVVVRAASKRAAYEWQYSLDGGKTWVTAPATLQARTTLTGLPPQALVEVRFRAVTKTGEGDWSAPLSVTVS